MFSTRIVGTITEVEKNDWDAMVGDWVFMSHGWMKTMEETNLVPMNRLYILVEESGRLVGGAVFEYCGSDRFDRLLFGRLKNRASRFGISFGPVLDAVPFRSYGNTCLVESGADPSRRKEIIGKVFSEMERLADQSGCSMGFSKVLDHEPELLEQLRDRGYSRSLVSPINYLDIEWPSFGEYRMHIGSISRNMESNIRKEVNKNVREGVVIRVLDDIRGHEDRMVELATMNRMKHNNLPFSFGRDFFSRLNENLGSDAVVYAAFKGAAMIGMALQLKRNGTAFSPIVGVDHDRSGNDATYFNLCYYRPIADAIQNKMTRIYFGFGMYELKARRGCRVLPVYVYFKSKNRLRDLVARNWMSVHSAWWGRKSPYNRLGKGGTLRGGGGQTMDSDGRTD